MPRRRTRAELEERVDELEDALDAIREQLDQALGEGEDEEEDGDTKE